MSGNPYGYDPTQFPPFPLDQTIAGESGRLTEAWYYFFLNIWNKIGGTGPIPGTGTGGGTGVVSPPQTLALVSNPFTFTAPASGFFTSVGGQVSLTRNGTTILIGGPSVQVPMAAGDKITLAWSGPTVPGPVVWWQG